MKNYSRRRLPVFTKEELRKMLNTPAPDEEKEKRRLKELEDEYRKALSNKNYLKNN